MEQSYVRMISALNNAVRRAVLATVAEGTYSVNELAEGLGARGVDYKSRDSLYKHAELLVAAGLLEKFYDVRKKAKCYRNPAVLVGIDLENWVIDVKREAARENTRATESVYAYEPL